MPKFKKGVIWTKTDYGYSAINGAWHAKLVELQQVAIHEVGPQELLTEMLQKETNLQTLYSITISHIPSGKELQSKPLIFLAAKNFAKMILCGLRDVK